MVLVLLLIYVQNSMLLPPAPVPDADRVAAAISHVLERARAGGAGGAHPEQQHRRRPRRTRNLRLGTSARGPPRRARSRQTDTRLLRRHPAGLRAAGVGPLVVAGMQSDFCVRAPALAALKRGHKSTLVHDAHATYDDEFSAAEESARVAGELSAAGVKLIGSEEVVFA
ncbi:isochorismatase family protein [Amycolatopsis rubida]|uniref:isochorismatase family protein n=1 Tax=Amycolatopsis TaxID=1813 RepID=UPI000BA3F33C